MTYLKFFARVVALGVVAVLVPPAAMAVTWNTSSSPLTAYENGIAQAKAYGNFYNYRSESAHNDSKQRDPRPGGDSVYVQTDFYWYGPNQRCGGSSSGLSSCFWHDTDKQTERSNSSIWESHYRARNLRGDADRSRGRAKVCEDHSWSWDQCSSRKIMTFSY